MKTSLIKSKKEIYIQLSLKEIYCLHGGLNYSINDLGETQFEVTHQMNMRDAEKLLESISELIDECEHKLK